MLLVDCRVAPLLAMTGEGGVPRNDLLITVIASPEKAWRSIRCLDCRVAPLLAMTGEGGVPRNDLLITVIASSLPSTKSSRALKGRGDP